MWLHERLGWDRLYLQKHSVGLWHSVEFRVFFRVQEVGFRGLGFRGLGSRGLGLRGLA